MLVTVSSVLATMVDIYTSNLHGYVNGVLWTIVAIGFGGFQANVIQFGIDQLHDASTNEITSFILWYVWTFYGDGFLLFFILGCLPEQYAIIGNLILCVYLSVALSSMLMFNHWLVKEPVTQNPFKLVYGVIRYAIKHKHPECRSAFTYCEDEPLSRIDFGKSKYGGPFTTEQVEDVKTLLRVILIIFSGAIIFYVIFVSWRQLERMLSLLTDNSSRISYHECYSVEAFVESFVFGSAIILPFYELFLYPIFHRCLGMINSHWKFISGVFLLIAETVALLVIESIARHRYYLTNNSYNTTIECIGDGTLSTSMDYRFMAVPLLLHSLSVTAVAIGAFEFFASQAPYSMRGLIMGVVYCTLTLFAALGMGISVPFTKQSSSWGSGIISCGFWYALLLLVVEVLFGFMLVAMQRCYKKRKREDVLPNEHIFAERYYDRDN
jgi:peptide/histidine transporter 3/4